MTVKRLNSAAAAVSLQLCSNLCNPKNCRLPGSPVHGTLQAGILACCDSWGHKESDTTE